ncbi:MAG: hypothetical protein AAF960_26785 [Bacteroidota bacterium]
MWTKKLKNFFFVALLFTTSALAAQSDFGGLWYAEEMDKATIEVYQSGDDLWYAKVTKSEDAKAVNSVIFEKGEYDSNKNELKGTLIKPGGNMRIDATISLENKEKAKIVGKKFFMTKTFYWAKM